jgi:phage FluMu protein Com
MRNTWKSNFVRELRKSYCNKHGPFSASVTTDHPDPKCPKCKLEAIKQKERDEREKLLKDLIQALEENPDLCLSLIKQIIGFIGSRCSLLQYVKRVLGGN